MSDLPPADSFNRSISDWDELAALIAHFSYYSGHDWLFRGVKDVSFGLRPKIGRDDSRAVKFDLVAGRQPLPYRKADEFAIFRSFKRQARAHLPNPPATELEWLALAQHFGLPTRLLDWTDSLLVAVWFAIDNWRSGSNDRAVWVTRGVTKVDADDVSDIDTLDEPVVFRPPHISPRIVSQASVLMICPQPTMDVQLPHTTKITIKRKALVTLTKRLNACGFNRRFIFPDLEGLAAHLGLLYEMDWLAADRNAGRNEAPPTPDPPAT